MNGAWSRAAGCSYEFYGIILSVDASLELLMSRETTLAAEIGCMKSSCRYAIALALVSSLALTSCATSSHALVGTARPAILPNEVAVLGYTPEKYEEIAEVKASSGVSLQSADEKWDRAIEGLRKEAARVGANAVVVDIPEESDEGEVTAGGSKPIANGNGKPIELGLGASTSHAPLWQSLHGLAIYVPN